MDPITHGIAGSLLGKGFFSNKHGRLAILAATLGAVFPDIDTVADVVSRNPLAIVRYHRGITHSFFGLPLFAMALAWLTRRAARWLGIDAPSWALLTFIYGLGIASHILMDGTTSFGTRMWTPFSNRRVAWDLIFIIDLIFSAILLVPQVVAWVYSDRERARNRSIKTWLAFSGAACAGWAAARLAGFPFHPWALAVSIAALAAAFLSPGWFGGWGFAVSRQSWCRAGLLAALVYVSLCALMHHMAMRRVTDYAIAHHIEASRIGALPLAPSLLDWGAALRTPNGVIESRFDLRDPDGSPFEFYPDSPSDRYISETLALPSVQLFWRFSRFPTIHSGVQDGYHFVDLGENRFMNQRPGPQPFTYRVLFDSKGNVVEEGMATDGMFLKRMVPEPQAAGEDNRESP